AMPAKTFDRAAFNKIIVRSLRIFCLGLFLNFFSKIELFGLEGIPLLFGRLAITIAVSYALMGNFSLKVKTYLVLTVFSLLLFLAFSGIEEYREVRIPGVLQRIGIVYFFVSLLYLKTTQKTQLLTASVLLLVYWAILALVPVPGIGVANFEKGTNLAAWLDNELLPGHLWVYTKTWDPEGILSTIPAIATGISGLLIGQLLNRPLPQLEIIKKMGIAGLTITVLGIVWSTVFPINKSLWTSSYVLYTSGIAILCLTVLYYVIDVANYKRWSTLFLIWGVNPMIVFFFSGIIPKVLRMIEFKNPEITAKTINLQDYFYSSCIVPFFNNPMSASLVFAILNVILWSFILWLFYKNKLIFKV
ncbi:MAG: DUF5009 domain-containing protein, partial [Flavobacterium sp.]